PADLPTKEFLMFPSLWFRRATGQPRPSGGRGRRQRPQLHLEPLEDRCLLSNYTTGPLTQISSPDPLADSKSGDVTGKDVAAEPYLAVNPANPNNIVAIWIDHDFADNAVAATFDGGRTWQTEALPGITHDTGGQLRDAADPWLTFAPNGDLYAVSEAF